MSRVVLAAALVFALSVSMSAQHGMRGFGGGRVAMGHPAPPMATARAPQRQFFAPRPAAVSRPGAGFVPQQRGFVSFGHVRGGPFFTTRRFDGRFDHRFHRRNFVVFVSPFYYGGYWPYYGYPYYSSLNSYASDPVANTSNYSDLSNQMNQLDADVRELRDENDSLRSMLEEQRRPPAPAPPAASTPRNEPATVIVYRDGHRTEVQNYAIVGSTLWLLSTSRATKVPLADIDLDQTMKVNEDRGVSFITPK